MIYLLIFSYFNYLCPMKKHLVIILALLFALSSCDSDLHHTKRYDYNMFIKISRALSGKLRLYDNIYY